MITVVSVKFPQATMECLYPNVVVDSYFRNKHRCWAGDGSRAFVAGFVQYAISGVFDRDEVIELLRTEGVLKAFISTDGVETQVIGGN